MTPEAVTQAWAFIASGEQNEAGAYYADELLALWELTALKKDRVLDLLFAVHNNLRKLAGEHLDLGNQCEAAGNAGGAAHMRAVAGLLFSFATRGESAPVPIPALGAPVPRNEVVLEQALREALDGWAADAPPEYEEQAIGTVLLHEPRRISELRLLLPESHTSQAALDDTRKAFK